MGENAISLLDEGKHPKLARWGKTP